VIVDKYKQQIYSENDILDIVMQGIDIKDFNILSKDNIPLDNVIKYVEPNISISEFDKNNQKDWYMPKEYKDMDIAQYVLSLCNTQEELQRCGNELLMYQDRNLFDLLRYLKYLVDTMEQNNIIWGVGRGSSVSSYVLYLLKVHKVNSMYYDLNVEEFLR
jgi:DNA polymerase III alpha subunit